MKNYRMLSLVSGMLVAFWLSPTVGQAAVVTATSGGAATLAIRDANNTDLADGTFPEPQQILKLVLTVNGVQTSISSISFAQPGTTNYRGTCTNSGLPSDTSLDFQYLGGDQIRSLDCGGTAVVLVNGTYTFTFPADSDGDGIPNWYEQTYCVTNNTCLLPNDDNERIGANTNAGDGFANIDEYRGFIVNGQHFRTNPTRKDLFVHLLNPVASCARKTTTTQPPLPPENSFLGTNSTTSSERAKVFPTDGTSLFADLTFSAVDFHFLSYVERGINSAPATEWVDNLSGLTGIAKDQPVYLSGTDGFVSDRRVNINALSPPSFGTHKGIRAIECLDESQIYPVGLATFPLGVQVSTPDEDTTTILYTQRIYNDYAQALTRSSTKGTTSAYQSCALTTQTCVYYQTYINGFSSNGTPTVTKTTPTRTYTPASGSACPGGATPPCTVDRNYITSKYIQYVTAMEVAHDVSLIPVLQITQYGAHYAPGTGDNLDQQIVAKDSKTLSGVVFSIPSSYSSKSNACFQLIPGTGSTSPSCQP